MKHRLFWVQLTIAGLLFAVLAISARITFLDDPESRNYVLADRKITNLRVSSSIVLEDLIEVNNLTFDPTNGVSIEKVLNNLKCSEKEKVLLLGSSQLVTLNDDWSSNNYLRRVDKRLEEISDNGVMVYNLSMGGMTTQEKKVILDKAQEVLKFDKIVVSIGPYDCRENQIRPGIHEIENISFQKINETNCDSLKKEMDLSDISIEKLNDAIETLVDERLEKNMFLLRNKGAIKLWAKNKTIDLVKKKSFSQPKKPLSWRTHNQKLNDFTGWAMGDYHGEKRSLKIIKENKELNSAWDGIKVDLKKPTKKVVLGGWSKSENVEDTKLYCLDFKIDFVDGTHKWVYEGLDFKKGTNGWTKRERVFQFEKEIKSITPKMLFYKGTGTVWFDNIYSHPIYDTIGENIILNPGAEEESYIKDVHSLSFTTDIWDEIFKNSLDISNYVGEKITSDEPEYYILIPPIYNSELKKGYEQNFMLDRFKRNLKEACENHGIRFLDANELLDESHFIEYESGNKKGLIEPLHFDTKGHEELARFLKKNLEL